MNIAKIKKLEEVNYPYGFSILRGNLIPRSPLDEPGWYVETGNWAFNVERDEICRFDGWLGWQDRNRPGKGILPYFLSRRDVVEILSVHTYSDFAT